MEDQQQQMWSTAHKVARRFLGRWPDTFTQEEREDLAQDAALAFCRYVASRCEPPELRPVVCTISRRLRGHALRRAVRTATAVAEDESIAWSDPAAEPVQCLRVSGVLVPRDWLVQCLMSLLARLGPTNRRLLLEFYGGSSCAAIGGQLGLSDQAVKVRLHRCRRLLRRQLEGLTRLAGRFER